MKTSVNTPMIVNVKDQVIKSKPQRMDFQAGKLVEINGYTLQVGQMVLYNEAYCNKSWWVCVGEPTNNRTQKLVEVGGRHRVTTWDIELNDRSIDQIFGIGLYYDNSGNILNAEEIAKHVRNAEIQSRWNERQETNKKRAALMERENLCKEWKGILTPIENIKDYTEKERTEKANIIAYLKHNFPGVKFTARKTAGGYSYCVSWTDGPSVKAVEDVARIWHDHTFNGYEDYNEYTPSQFNRLFGGVTYSIDTNRKDSPEATAEARKALQEICPEVAELIGCEKDILLPQDSCGALNAWLDMTVNRHPNNPTARAIFEAGEHHAKNWYSINPLALLRNYLENQDRTAKSNTAAPTESNEDDKPADGLALVDIAGGVAVVGDARTTYRNRKQIKAHGAKWNKDAQQWQATDNEAVASLRRWFGVGNPEQPTPDDDPTPTKGNEESTEEATEATETTATDNNTTESERSAQSEEKPLNVANNRNCPEWLKVGASFCLIDFVTGKPTNVVYKCTAIDEKNETFTISTDTHGSREYGFNSFYWSQFAPVEPTPTTANEEPQSEEKAANPTLYDNEKLTVFTETETANTFSPHDMVSYKGGVFELLGMRGDGTEATIKAKGGSRLCVPIAELEASIERKTRLPEWMKRGQVITNGKYTLIIASVGNGNINVIDDSPLQIAAALLKYEPVEAAPAPEWLKPGAKVIIRNNPIPADVLAVDGCAVAVHQDFGEGCTYDHDVKMEDLKPYYSACEKSPFPEKQETERSFNVGDSVMIHLSCA